jgi:hypothetical protein
MIQNVVQWQASVNMSQPSYSNKTGILHLLRNKLITFQGKPCILTCLMLQEYTHNTLPKRATMG